MKIQYLGTAAFEGIPALFCECETCRKARELGGKNMRTRSQAIIDDCLLIDFPADTYGHFLKYNLPMSKIKTCLITHSHCDHFYPEDMCARGRGCFAHIDTDTPMKVYSGEDAYNKNKKINGGVSETDLLPILVQPFESFESDGYKITPLKATHAQNTSPYIYLIEKNGKNLLYAHDSGDFPKETWKYLDECGKSIDLVSLDCTEAESIIDYDAHMCVSICNSVRAKMIDMGICSEKTKFVLNHFSHNGKNVLYDSLAESPDTKDFIISYDGMILEF